MQQTKVGNDMVAIHYRPSRRSTLRAALETLAEIATLAALVAVGILFLVAFTPTH